MLTRCLVDVFTKIRLDADRVQTQKSAVTSTTRGNPIKNLGLSAKRLLEVRQGKKLVEILERCAAELLSKADVDGDWFNQLNVAGGFFGNSPKHLDLLRVPFAEPSHWQFIEVKGWPEAEADHPLATAIQVFVYSALATTLGAMARDQENMPWRSITRIEMGVAAPTTWYASYSRDGYIEETFQCFSRAVANVPRILWAPFEFEMEFIGEGNQIDLSRDDFVGFFSQTPIEEYVEVAHA